MNIEENLDVSRFDDSSDSEFGYDPKVGNYQTDTEQFVTECDYENSPELNFTMGKDSTKRERMADVEKQ